jgi:hypothetical protein
LAEGFGVIAFGYMDPDQLSMGRFPEWVDSHAGQSGLYCRAELTPLLESARQLFQSVEACLSVALLLK